MDYQLKPMTLGEILDASFGVFRDNFWLLVAITGVVVFVPNVVPSLIVATSGVMPEDPGQFTDETWAVLFAGLGVWLILVLAMLVLAPFANAAVMKAVADRFLSRPTSFGSAYGYVFRRFWKLLGVVLLSGLLIALGSLACVIPGILLMLHYFVVSPVVVVEDMGGMTALRRSGELMKGNWGTAFVLLILLGILNWVIGWGVGFLPVLWLRGIAQAALTVVTTSFTQVATTVLYLSARCEKEAFDLEQLATSLVAGPAPTA